MANKPYELHKEIIHIFCGSWQREDSIFRCCTWALKSYSWCKKIMLHLGCIGRVLDFVKSSKCDKQYNTWNNLRVSFRTYNHYDCCTKEAENSPSWNSIYGNAEYTLTVKQLTTSLYLISDSAMLIYLSGLEVTHQSWLELNFWKHVNGF